MWEGWSTCRVYANMSMWLLIRVRERESMHVCIREHMCV